MPKTSYFYKSITFSGASQDKCVIPEFTAQEVRLFYTEKIIVAANKITGN